MWNAYNQIHELSKIKYKGFYYRKSKYKGNVDSLDDLTDKYKEVMQSVFTFSVDNEKKNFFEKFSKALSDTGALHAGGSLTVIAITTQKHINYVIQDIKDGYIDLDIYVDANNYNTMLNVFIDIGFKIEKTVGTPAYDASFMRENQIITRVCLKKEKLLVDLMIVHNKNGKTPLDVVQNFDLTCCEVWFDGKRCNASHFDDFKQKPVEMTAGGLINNIAYSTIPETQSPRPGTHKKARVTTMRPQYVSKYISGNNFLHKRVRKYETRGFVIKFQSKQDIYYITRMKGRKNITNTTEFLLSKLYAHVFTKKQIVQLVEASLENEWPFQTVNELKEFLNIEAGLRGRASGGGVRRGRAGLGRAGEAGGTSGRGAPEERDVVVPVDEFTKFIKKIRGILHQTNQISSMGSSVALKIRLLMPYLYDGDLEKDVLETYKAWLYKIRDRFGIDWSRFITAISNTTLDLSIKNNFNQFIIEIFAESTKTELIEFGVSIFKQIQKKLAFDVIEMKDVLVSDYLAENKDNIVVVEQDNKKIDIFLTRITGPGGLKDFINTKYFVKCHSSDIALSSDTESTQFKEWYIKLMGTRNICIPMGAVYDVCTMIENEEAEPIIIVSSNNIKNASDVETTFFERGLNIFMDQVNLVSATHCNASEHFMENVAYVRKW